MNVKGEVKKESTGNRGRIQMSTRSDKDRVLSFSEWWLF